MMGHGFEFSETMMKDAANTEPSVKPKSPTHNAAMTWLRSLEASEVGASQAMMLIEDLELEIAQLRREVVAPDEPLANTVEADEVRLVAMPGVDARFAAQEMEIAARTSPGGHLLEWVTHP